MLKTALFYATKNIVRIIVQSHIGKFSKGLDEAKEKVGLLWI